MKIAGRTFLNKNILKSDDDNFHAKYKGCEIIVKSEHGHGDARYKHLTRFDITVTDKRGCYAVSDYGDYNTIRSAVIYALDGAKL